MIYFFGRSLSFFLTRGILIVFISVLDTVKVKSSSLYDFINSCISSLIFFCSVSFSIFKIFDSGKIESIFRLVIPYSFSLLKTTFSIHFFFEKLAVKISS